MTALLTAALPALAAKPPKVQWLDTISGLGGAYGSWVTQTTDGGYIAAGSSGIDSLGAPGYFYYYVVRIDTAGDTLWTRTVIRESVGYEDGTACGVLQARDGGFVVLGSDKGADYCEHPYVVKLDSTGALLWQSIIDGDTFEHVSAFQQATDGGYVLAGPLERTGLYLMKIDSVGTRLWCRTLDDEETRSRHEYDMRESWPPSIPLAAASDDGFVTASRNDKVGLILLKVDSVGTEVWRQTYGSDSAAGGRAIARTADGGFAITGPAGVWKHSKPCLIYLLKVDSLGNKQWCRYFGKHDLRNSYSVWQTSDGGFIMTGAVSSVKNGRARNDAFVLRTDGCGNGLWYTTIAPLTTDGCYGSCVQQTSDGGYVVCGTRARRTGPNRVRACLFVAKFAPDRTR